MADEIPAPPEPSTKTAQTVVSIGRAVAAMLTPDEKAGLAGFIGGILAPIAGEMEDRIVARVVAALKDTAEIGKPNETLQNDFDLPDVPVV